MTHSFKNNPLFFISIPHHHLELFNMPGHAEQALT